MKRFLWIFLTFLLSWVALGNFIFSQYRLRETLSQTREQLALLAASGALSIDAQEVAQVPLQRAADHSLAYQSLSEKLETIKRLNPFLKYVYIMTLTDQLGILRYVADADPAPPVITARCLSALPGDVYDAGKIPEMLEAYGEPAADKEITTDAWGSFVSGYAPIRDAQGKTVAILGVDVDAAGIAKLQKNAHFSGLLELAAFFLFIISLFVSLIFGSQDLDPSR